MHLGAKLIDLRGESTVERIAHQPNNMTTPITLDRDERGYQRALSAFRENPTISIRNKELICRFLQDAALGKTGFGRRRKRIGPSRLVGYINTLRILVRYLQKDLDQVNDDDMERFVTALDAGMIRTRGRASAGNRVIGQDQPLSLQYRVLIKASVKKFYKWLLGGSRNYPAMVEWIDTTLPFVEVPTLTEREIERMLDRGRTPLQRALVQVLFDGGFRISELLNVRLCHVALKRFDPQDSAKTCFVVRVVVSKTFPRTVALPMYLTTKWLQLWLEDHPEKPIVQPDGTLHARDLQTPLFPISGGWARDILHRVGKLALGKRVYPHLLRHSSATYWSNKLPWFKLCKRFGWTMTSTMPQRYIDRAGVDELEVVQLYHKDAPSERDRAQQPWHPELSEDTHADVEATSGGARLSPRPGPPGLDVGDARAFRKVALQARRR